MNFTIQEKLIYRNIRKSAIIWLLMIRLDPQPLTETLASEILDIDRSTARKYLTNLQEMELISRLGRFDGYILTNAGRQLALPLELQQLQEKTKEEISPSALFNNDESLISLKDLKSLLLIKSEGGNSPNEGGNFPFDHQNGAGCGKNGDSCGEPVEKISMDEIIDQILAKDPAKKEILEELLHWRIQMNSRTINLLLAEDITREEIRSQALALDQRGYGNQTGILITNLESKYRAEGAALDPITGHEASCNCHDCINSRNTRFLEKFQQWED